jgi:Uma2 family endonuclease
MLFQRHVPIHRAETVRRRRDKVSRMNGSFAQMSRPTTRAADGLPRWSWTVAEIERMAAGGYFRDEDRFELVGGEIVPMSPKGRRHEILRTALAFRFSRAAQEGVFVASETQFNLAGDTYAVPDVLVHPSDIKTPDVRGSDVLLVVEIADTTLAYDLRTKTRLYASHGVREYWVMNAASHVTTVHTQPSGTEYAVVQEVAGGAKMSPGLVPALAISLATLDLD